MGGGERLTLALANGCGEMNVTNARQITLEQATTAPTAVQRWMVMGMADFLARLLLTIAYTCLSLIINGGIYYVLWKVM
jgi:hypothetical protein